ncbi:MAG: hypothetical protein FH759_14385 [Sediminimonas qiaohouensis]|uniref:Polyketide cyclase n=1 Tax=Sediminimonas qiaohouensis TaxID=552061 RepID=A0A7C9LQV7_9RHOB|nr:hypothetical protein [Sediminimonas qiaohouensis]
MLTITREVRITASPAVVWDVTVEVLDWPRWLPTVTAVRQLAGSRFETGSRYAVKQPLQPEMAWKVTGIAP